VINSIDTGDVGEVGKAVAFMPRTTRTHGASGTRVPSDVLRRLHNRLCEAYPELGALPLETTRLCWYLDTPDEDWVIDEVAGHGSLFIASGGSGHAFKVRHLLTVVGLVYSVAHDRSWVLLFPLWWSRARASSFQLLEDL